MTVRRLALTALAWLALATAASGQLSPRDATKRPTCTDGRPWSVWLLNESSATDCDTTAGGSSEAFCCCKDGAVAACASGGSGNSFETVDAPSGTDPAADSSTDTLTLTASGGLTITGDSAADSLAFAVGNVATATALAANPADCSGAANEFAWRIAASGDLSCASVSFPNTVPASSAFTVGGANSVWGASSSTLVFEGATADAFETVLASGDPTGDRVIYLPDASGGLVTSTCSNCWADAANGLSGEAGVLVFEGSSADGFETRFYATNATADRYIEAPDATGYVMLSDCSTCSGAAASSVQGTTNGFLFEGTTANGFETTFTAGDPTADRAIALPDESGTIITTSSNLVSHLITYKPGSADTPDDDFSSGTLAGKWTVLSGAAGTVNLIETGTTIEEYDLATRPGWLLMQAGRNISQTVSMRQDYTLPDGNSIIVAFSVNSGSSATATLNNSLQVSLAINSDDTTLRTAPYLEVFYDSQTTDASRIYVSSNVGSDYAGPPVGAAGGMIYFRIARSSLTYAAFASVDGTTWMPVANRTLASAPTNVWIQIDTVAAITGPIAPIVGVDWIRLGTNSLDPW